MNDKSANSAMSREEQCLTKALEITNNYLVTFNERFSVVIRCRHDWVIKVDVSFVVGFGCVFVRL